MLLLNRDGDEVLLIFVREPQPGYMHGNIQIRLGSVLARHIAEHRLDLECVGPVGFVLQRDPATVRGPDLAVFHRSRVPSHDPVGFVEGAPDLAIEIASPSNTHTEIGGNVGDYLEAGARMVWVVHPETRTVVVHAPAAASRSYGTKEELDGGDLVPALRISVAGIFES